MTVADLIEELKKQDPSHNVEVHSSYVDDKIEATARSVKYIGGGLVAIIAWDYVPS